MKTRKVYKYWVTLYDRDDRQIDRYLINGDLPLNPLMLNWALNHLDIEYVKITPTPPDESIDETI